MKAMTINNIEDVLGPVEESYRLIRRCDSTQVEFYPVSLQYCLLTHGKSMEWHDEHDGIEEMRLKYQYMLSHGWTTN